jgi:Zn-dependent protease with chaperone function
MNFFEQQDRSRQATKTLVGLFAASVMFTGLCVYGAVMLTINTTFLRSIVFGNLTCQPIVPISATAHPRMLSAQPLIPLLPSIKQPDYQLKGGGIFRAGNSVSRNFRSNSHYSTFGSHSNSNSNSNPSCRLSTIWWDFRVFFWTLIGTAILMGLPSLWKINQLKSGGAVIAAELGGMRIFPETATPAEQQLLNVVEEMAIAATIAVPPVYVLVDESSINALAAGFTINDAVIAVTQGSLDQLTRDELQAMVAHEFSHILNGDMAMNIRLMGMLHGILCLHLAGRVLSYAGYGRDNPFVRFGFLLQIIGFSGFISGRLIQSKIAKQRELLADASAVQFTRNPEAVASALAKTSEYGSYLSSPYAETNNHMFFAPAIDFGGFDGIFAAHPPFNQRTQIAQGIGKKLGQKTTVNGQAVPLIQPIMRIETGELDADTSDELNIPVAEAGSTVIPVGEYGALAYLYALLLDRDQAPAQLTYLAQLEEPAVIEQIEQMKSVVEVIPPHQRLTGLDRQVTKLRDTTHAPRLLKCAYGMVDLLPADNWQTTLVYLVLNHRLAPTTGTSAEIYQSIEDVWPEMLNILGTLARLTNTKPQDIEYSFEASLMRLPASHARSAKLPAAIIWREFQTDLAKIAVATPKIKQSLIAACLEILNQQRHLPVDGANLMRSIAILLDCPIPPRLDKSSQPQQVMR